MHRSGRALDCAPRGPLKTTGSLSKQHLAGLNPEQLRAVKATQGPVLVLAGAGTGKTRVITCRIAQLLQERVSPEHVLAVTFTNKASREMKSRVTKLVGKANGKLLTVGTFHRFCLDLLREYPREAGLPRRFSICDSSDQIGSIKRALHELNIGDTALNPRVAQSRISLLKNRMLDPEAFLEGAADDHEELLGRTWRRYEEHLRSTGSVDFDDLLLRAELLLRKNADVLAAVRDKNRYVLVDEYQDTNGPQYEIVRHIAGEHRNLCVVGDDDQSIYSWRGADVTRILRFEQDYPGAVVCRLETNYRSTKPILDAANRVIRNNPERHDKSLRSAIGAGEPLQLRQCKDEVEEADATVQEILYLERTRKQSFGEIAILFRTGIQARVFETHLRARGVPYVLVGGPSFFDRKEVRDVLGYLRLVANPEDEASFLRVVNCPPRGVGKTTLERALAEASRSNRSVMAVFEEGTTEGLARAGVAAVQDFLRLTATLAKRTDTRDVLSLVREVITAVAYKSEVERRYPDPTVARDRWSAVDEIKNAAEHHMRRAKQPSLAGFLQELALSAGDDRTPEDSEQRNVVTLMTLHAAKGLEFPRVYLVGLEEGLLPHARSVHEDSVEEERRLAYVGITRAQRHLMLSYAAERSKAGHRLQAHPSRFVFEVRGVEPPADWIPTGMAAPPGAPAGRGRKAAGKRKAGAKRKTSAKRGKAKARKSSGPG